MSATINITLQVQISTQKSDKVAVTGSLPSLGGWDPEKLLFLKPKKSIHEGDVWFTKIDMPLNTEGLEYRYLVCRKWSHEGDEDSYLIRHWESGIMPRYKTILELGKNPVVDIYGTFEPERKMFVDKGWLINETEIQLRFYKDPIHMFKKRDRGSEYNVKCSAINLQHHAAENTRGSETEEYFEQLIHSSNPLIRVTSLGKYHNKEQPSTGMSVSSNDYVIYKLRTFDPDSHGIKVDFFKPSEDGQPQALGYTNILPLHLESGSGSVVLAINGSHGFPIGQVTVRYLVCHPNKKMKCDLRKSSTKWWNRERPTLDIGHRGLGDTHSTNINSKELNEQPKIHENTIHSLITASNAAEFVEFDVMLSKDRVPIIWHDFNVSILLRKKTKGHHRVHHIPVHELTLSQLQDLRVEFAKDDSQQEHYDRAESVDAEAEHANQNDHHTSPFPTLKEALDVVDDCVGFYVELKYPQSLYDTQQKEEGLQSYIERNEYLDAILKVLIEHPRHRRMILASFDPDVCIMARLKQNLWPVIMLIEDLGANEKPYFHDLRTQRITTAVSLAKSEKFLGLSVNAACLMRKEEDLLDGILSNNLICFVWGRDANNAEVRENLRRRSVHAICYDEIETDGKVSIYRAEHEEKIRRLMVDLSMSPGVSPVPSVTNSAANSLLGSAPDLLSLINEAEDLIKAGVISPVSGRTSCSILREKRISPKASTSLGDTRESSASIPVLRVTPVPIPTSLTNGKSDPSPSKAKANKSQSADPRTNKSEPLKPSPPTSDSSTKANDGDYTKDFY